MSFFEIVKSFIPLLIIFGLLFGVLIVVKKYSFTLGGKRSRALNIDVINNQMILPKKYISVVRVLDKVLVLGICENNITLLKELDYNSISTEDIVNIESKPNIVDILKQNLGMK
jgi:flagellar protein FliO/FliZ